MKDPRQNKNISTDQVIALSCEIASEELHLVWDTHYSDMSKDQLDEKGGLTGEYTDKAQDVFNKIYDDVEGLIVEQMELDPTANIQQIEKIMRTQWGQNKGSK